MNPAKIVVHTNGAQPMSKRHQRPLLCAPLCNSFPSHKQSSKSHRIAAAYIEDYGKPCPDTPSKRGQDGKAISQSLCDELRHATDGTERIAVDQSCDNRPAFFGNQLIHINNILDSSSITVNNIYKIFHENNVLTNSTVSL